MGGYFHRPFLLLGELPPCRTCSGIHGPRNKCGVAFDIEIFLKPDIRVHWYQAFVVSGGVKISLG